MENPAQFYKKALKKLSAPIVQRASTRSYQRFVPISTHPQQLACQRQTPCGTTSRSRKSRLRSDSRS